MKTLLIMVGGGIALLVLAIVAAALTGNIKKMTPEELKALDDRIKANGSPTMPPPPPKVWPSRVPRTGPQVADPWEYALAKMLADPGSWFIEGARYRLDDPAAARAALAEQLKWDDLEEIPKWRDALDVIATDAGGAYREKITDADHCRRIGAQLERLFADPVVITKGHNEWQAVLVDLGVIPGKVRYASGKFGGWKVDKGDHSDPAPGHWSAWKSSELAAALLFWRSRYPDASLFVLRLTEPHNYASRHAYYQWRKLGGEVWTLSYWQPPSVGELGDPFDPRSSETDPHYLDGHFSPHIISCQPDDLVSAAAGRLDLNERFFNPLVPEPAPPPLTQAEKDRLVQKLLEEAKGLFQKKPPSP